MLFTKMQSGTRERFVNIKWILVRQYIQLIIDWKSGRGKCLICKVFCIEIRFALCPNAADKKTLNFELVQCAQSDPSHPSGID